MSSRRRQRPGAGGQPPGRDARRDPPARPRSRLPPGGGRGRRARRGRHGRARRCRPFDNSAMDGYAVRAGDLAAATEAAPVTLPVTAEIAAGDTGVLPVAPGTCVRIMTGALLPAGADAVVPVEWTDGGTGQVAVLPPGRQRARNPAPWRRRGQGRRAADGGHPGRSRCSWRCWRPSGHGVRAGPAAATGRGDRRPATSSPSPGRRSCPARSGTRTASCWPRPRGRPAACAQRHRVSDDPAAVLAAIEEQLPRADLLITSGGVSMGGEHDVVKAALAGLGTDTFRKVAMQPGMPQGFGVVGPGRTPIFTLPGNPVSAYVSFLLFVRPALDALQGLPTERLPQAARSSPTRCAPRRQAVVPAGRSRRRGGHGDAADRPGLPPAWRAGPGERADHRAGAGDLDGSGRHGRRNVAAMTDGGQRSRHLDASGHARMVDVSGKDVTARRGPRVRAGAAVRRGDRRAAGRAGAQGRRPGGGPDRRDPGRQADPGPDPAVPPDRAARGHGGPGGDATTPSRSRPWRAPRTGPGWRWRR